LLKITAAPLGAYSTFQVPPELANLDHDLPSLSTQSSSPGEVVSSKGIGPVIQTGEGLLLLRECSWLANALSQGGTLPMAAAAVGRCFENVN